MEFLGLFIFIAGFVIGLGAVTVIDLHGFLGRTSTYWTEATTRTHKVTKPLIWLGTSLAILGGFLYYGLIGINWITKIHILLGVILILNGLFLTFSVSPFLIKREKKGEQKKLLPKKWQTKITFSFIVSFISWWGSLALLVFSLV